jgi:hypothetical protein
MQQESSIQERRKIKKKWAIPVQNGKVLSAPYHTVALTVNIKH